MHLPASAVTLARTMLWLSRARATGVLCVRCEASSCHMAWVDGAIQAAMSSREGAEHGDLRDRVCTVFRWPNHELRFTSGAAEFGVLCLRDTLPAAALILQGMRLAAARANLALEAGCELAPWGRWLLEAAGERPLLLALQRGSAADPSAADGGDHAASVYRALRAFGALAPRAPARADYTLLLRKRAELRRRVPARELLDFPPGAAVTPAAARIALRKLTSHLHPDCLGPDAPASARALSHEVMQALTVAAASLR